MPCANDTKQNTSINYYLLEPATFKLDGGAMYGIIPKPLWQKNHPADELNRVDLSLRLWVIETKNKLIVVDTGIGDYHDEKFNKMFDVKSDKNPIEQALLNIGKSASEVTDLVITHLHFDHVGGIGTKIDGQWKATFENATLHLHKDHLEYSQNSTPRDSGSFHTHNFIPVIDLYKEKGTLILYSGQEGNLFDLDEKGEDKLSFKCSHGHTPWLMHPYTSDLIYMADLIPTSNHISIPWVMGYDISPGVTTRDKEEMLNFIKSKDLTMIYEHDPKYWGSKVGLNAKKKTAAVELSPRQEKLSYPIHL
jgi:glyoxylase-like metal-dependent hydrolase (beta-lactamase superfamily II)